MSTVMLRILDEAEQAAARIDWSGGGGGAATSGDGTMVAGSGKGGGAASITFQEVMPGTAAQRSERYRWWSERLRALGPPYNEIRFFEAAVHVTGLLSRGEGGLFGGVLDGITHFSRRWYGDDHIDYTGANEFLSGVGEALYALNRGIYLALVTHALVNPGQPLPSPMADTPGYESDATVSNALEFDVHMVFREQMEVTALYEAALASGDINEAQVAAINALLNYEYVNNETWVPGVSHARDALKGDDRFIDWARAANGDQPIDFASSTDRIAMGVAQVFIEHDLSQQQYNDYMVRVHQALANGDPIPPVTIDGREPTTASEGP